MHTSIICHTQNMACGGWHLELDDAKAQIIHGMLAILLDVRKT